MIDLLHRKQGEENSGWVTDTLLRSAGPVSGLDTDKLFADSNPSATQMTIRSTGLQAQQDMGGRADADVPRREGKPAAVPL